MNVPGDPGMFFLSLSAYFFITVRLSEFTGSIVVNYRYTFLLYSLSFSYFPKTFGNLIKLEFFWEGI
jgi:hypothetical protein